MRYLIRIILTVATIASLPQLAVAETWAIYRHRPPGCEAPAYAWVGISILPNPQNPLEDVHLLQCLGCGEIKCTCDDVQWRLISARTADRALNDAVLRFQGGELSGGLQTTDGSKVVRATWVGVSDGESEQQNILITID